MTLNRAVKTISYVKTHASEIIRDLDESGGSVIITVDGEAKAVIQGIKEYEEFQESHALLKILAQSKKSLAEGRHKPALKDFKDLRKKNHDLS